MEREKTYIKVLEFIRDVLLIIGAIYLIVFFVDRIEKSDKEAIDYCINQGYSEFLCTDFQR